MAVFDNITIRYVSIILVKEVDGKQTNLPLLPHLKRLVINESIFTKFVEGNIEFNDTLKWFNKYDIVGDETLIFTIEDTLNKKEKIILKYKVTSFEVISAPNNPQQIVTLYFKDEKYQKFLTEYSTSFKDKLITDFVRDFSENVLGKELEEVEDSKDRRSFSIPYQKFHYILVYLNQYLLSKNNYVGYLYFSDLKYSYFVTLPYLIHNKKPTLEFKEVLSTQVDRDTNFFNDFKRNKTFDIFDAISNRGVGSTIQRFDYESKDIVEETIKYSNYIKEIPGLGKYSLFMPDYDNEKSFVYTAASSNYKHKISILESNIMNGDIIPITFDGDLSRSCGKIAKLNFIDYTDASSKVNKTWDGNYLITSITHEFQPGKFYQHIEFMRNAKMIKTNNKQIALNKVNV